ncbi:hypothetical protein [Vitiosangium sp. GDMCC 1.1324]|uniref:hypothetical protein n=1 Tax=Vitiosangium sp. (strain GDMCC 1.1324) TaxID=2138576 RepID=UPI000D363747|nr:hypothetical protein [Vitiosangium sp. GDMCC 1.1324]PTL84242.1 hypothetical protein DAT35_12485 [Vitiosangium sp. GDMCC 1.1324]
MKKSFKKSGERFLGGWRLVAIAALALAGCGPSLEPEAANAATVTEETQPDEVSAAWSPQGQVVVLTASGNIAGAVDQFRALLGDPLNVIPGQQRSGRREINWDGVPPALTNVDNFPGDFFNAVDPNAPAGRKRGAVFTTTATGFRVSDNDFSDIDPSYGDEFNAFSLPRTFMVAGGNTLDVTFRVAGTNTPAHVKGFGVVFSDVDRVGSATIQLFDKRGRSLGTFAALARSDASGFSFLGVVFDQTVVARVHITSGDAALGAGVKDVSAGGTADLVVMDDYLYGEPKRIQ